MNLVRQTMAEYRATKAVGCSDVLNMRRSPAYARYCKAHPRPDTDATRLGSLWHCLTLEPETERDRFTVAQQCAASKKGDGSRCSNPGSLVAGDDWYCRLKGHAPLAAGAPTLTVVSADQIALARAMAESLRAHPEWATLTIGARLEQSVLFEWNGIRCKARADALTADGNIVLDLKSMARTERLAYDVEARGLHIRAAWYLKAFKAQCYVPAIVNSTEPHEPWLYMVDGWWLEQGEEQLGLLWSKFRDCYEANHWPGGNDRIESLPEPRWRKGDDDLDTSGLETEEDHVEA